LPTLERPIGDVKLNGMTLLCYVDQAYLPYRSPKGLQKGARRVGILPCEWFYPSQW